MRCQQTYLESLPMLTANARTKVHAASEQPAPGALPPNESSLNASTKVPAEKRARAACARRAAIKRETKLNASTARGNEGKRQRKRVSRNCRACMRTRSNAVRYSVDTCSGPRNLRVHMRIRDTFRLQQPRARPTRVDPFARMCSSVTAPSEHIQH